MSTIKKGILGKKRSLLAYKSQKSHSLASNNYKNKKSKIKPNIKAKRMSYCKSIIKNGQKARFLKNMIKENIVNFKNRKGSKSLKKGVFKRKFTSDNIYS